MSKLTLGKPLYPPDQASLSKTFVSKTHGVWKISEETERKIEAIEWHRRQVLRLAHTIIFK